MRNFAAEHSIQSLEKIISIIIHNILSIFCYCIEFIICKSLYPFNRIFAKNVYDLIAFQSIKSFLFIISLFSAKVNCFCEFSSAEFADSCTEFNVESRSSICRSSSRSISSIERPSSILSISACISSSVSMGVVTLHRQNGCIGGQYELLQAVFPDHTHYRDIIKRVIRRLERIHLSLQFGDYMFGRLVLNAFEHADESCHTKA